MNPNDPIRQILFENGTIAYAGPGHDFSVRDSNGSLIKQVSSRELSPKERQANATFIVDPKLQTAVPQGKGWITRQKTTQELVDEGIIDGKSVEETLRNHGKKLEI